ncbi:hypothetical protein FE257_012203 [Aspergillus nanangensis]|uniref:BTB domain-containing protein n=1 Tax=Aspergillus nanangensis TaxID=2582783 RepID=A0AAD4GS07_ASPNN|nr:hypothetical protein FE257_012203 [Aspergillus nanangensis]
MDSPQIGLEASPANPNLHDDGSSGLARKLKHTSNYIQENPKFIPTNVILGNGDVIVEYVVPGTAPHVPRANTVHRWQISSDDLRANSPYFRALLDPSKFYEGRKFMQQKSARPVTTITSGDVATQPNNGAISDMTLHSLPIIRLPVDLFPLEFGPDAIELFLKVLCFKSFDDEEKETFNAEMKLKPTSLIARLIELADAFNSPHVIHQAMTRSGYNFGKGKVSLLKFDTSILRQSEDRIRQTIFIARFLNRCDVFQITTHALIIHGSKFWTNGVEMPSPLIFHWRYLPDGLEEELYYRRQCILSTITDLQASFLRVYGALEFDEDMKQPTTSQATTTVPTRQYQCRCGFGNASACDAFHLGQMTRFFALRTKTIFLGSTLIDPDFGSDIEDDSDSSNEDQCHYNAGSSTPAAPPKDITSIISSLKQFPDYQIDQNHTGCGVRRRFLPPLDCIERFIGDSRALVGVDLQAWDTKLWRRASGSWANRSLRRALIINVHFSKINAVPALTSGRQFPDPQEENARLLFTAKQRNWES